MKLSRPLFLVFVLMAGIPNSSLAQTSEERSGLGIDVSMNYYRGTDSRFHGTSSRIILTFDFDSVLTIGFLTEHMNISGNEGGVNIAPSVNIVALRVMRVLKGPVSVGFDFGGANISGIGSEERNALMTDFIVGVTFLERKIATLATDAHFHFLYRIMDFEVIPAGRVLPGDIDNFDGLNFTIGLGIKF